MQGYLYLVPVGLEDVPHRGIPAVRRRWRGGGRPGGPISNPSSAAAAASCSGWATSISKTSDRVRKLTSGFGASATGHAPAPLRTTSAPLLLGQAGDGKGQRRVGQYPCHQDSLSSQQSHQAVRLQADPSPHRGEPADPHRGSRPDPHRGSRLTLTGGVGSKPVRRPAGCEVGGCVCKGMAHACRNTRRNRPGRGGGLAARLAVGGDPGGHRIA